MMKRWGVWVLYALALAALTAIPFRASISEGALPGAGADVLSTVWGMWWFQQEWANAAWGGWTEIANYPKGSFGAVLGISGAITWALAEPILGIVGACLLVNVTQLAGIGLGTAYLARRLGVSVPGAMFAGFAVFVSRYLFFDAGEGSIVAVAALPIPLGLAACTTRGWKAALALAVCIMWAALENPYLAPILPAVAAVRLLVDRDPWRLGGIVLGSVGTLGITHLFSKAANPDYPLVMHMEGGAYRLGPWLLQAVDMPWARGTLSEMLWPGAVSWTTSANNAEAATGGAYLGLTLFAAALCSAFLVRRRAAGWLLLGGVCMVLALGSVAFGPFLLLNEVMAAIARPLTQPTRFLAVALIAFAIPVGMLFDELRGRYGAKAYALVGVLALDAVLFGGLSLKAPAMPLYDAECIEDLDGPVLVWPTDAARRFPIESQQLQLLHEQPSPHRGIASWKVHEYYVHDDLEALGFTWPTRGAVRRDVQGVRDLGFRYIIALPDDEAPLPNDFARNEVARCGEIVVYGL